MALVHAVTCINTGYTAPVGVQVTCPPFSVGVPCDYRPMNAMVHMSPNGDAWDDADLVDAFEMEKAAGNVYLSSDEEAAYPGHWIPVTSASQQNWDGVPIVAGPVPMIPVMIPSNPPPPPPLIKISRGNGKLFQTVFPEEPTPRGKLYRAVVPKTPESDPKKPETNGITKPGSMEGMLQAHYTAGYQAGYAAALLEMERVGFMKSASPPVENTFDMNIGGQGGLYYF